MKNFFIPTEKNNYIPYLLGRKSILIYIIVFLIFNSFISQLGVSIVAAEISANQLLEFHNSQRREKGLPELRYSEKLSISAANKAVAMLKSDCWSHYCPSNKSPWDFFIEAKYDYSHAGENLAEGFFDIDNVINAWMNSPTHRENILNSNFKEVGFGLIYGNYQGRENNLIVVVHFGSPISQVTPKTQNIAQVKEVKRENFVDITSPKNNSIINSSNIEISGQVYPTNSNVEIYLDSSLEGTVSAAGENYTYKSEQALQDGSYQLQSKINNELESNIVNIILDGNKPILYVDSTIIKEVENEFILTLSTSPDVKQIEIKEHQIISQEKNTNTVWNLVIDKLSPLETLNITVSDQANNSSEYQLPVGNYYIEQVEEDNPIYSETLQGKSIMSVFSIGFITYILSLMGIDYYVLRTTKSFGINKRNYHFNFSLLIILFIVIFIGGFSGEVITGINI